MIDLITVISATRDLPDADWPADFTVKVNFGEGAGEETVTFGYDPNDPFGDLNPQVAAWLLSNPDFEIDPYEAPLDPVPSDFTLTKRQIMRALIISGTTTDPDGFIASACAAIADPTDRALALTDWQTAPFYKRDHALFNDEDMLAEVNMTSADIDALWMLAKDQPA